MADRVDFRPVSFLSEKRIIGRNRSVIFQAQNLSEIFRWILCEFPKITVSAGDIEETGLVERET